MTETKGTRLSKLAKEYNIGIHNIVEFLKKKGHEVENSPNTKISAELVALLEKEYSTDKTAKKESEKVNLKSLREKKETISLDDIKEGKTRKEEEDEEEIVRIKSTIEPEIKIVGKIDLPAKPSREKETEPVKEKTSSPSLEKKTEEKTETKEQKQKAKEVPEQNITTSASETFSPVEEKTEIQPESEIPSQEQAKEPEDVTEKVKETEIPEEDKNFIKTKIEKLTGPTVLGKIDLPVADDGRPTLSDLRELGKKKKRKRIRVDKISVEEQKKFSKPADREKDFRKGSQGAAKKTKRPIRPEVDEEDVQRLVKETLAKLTAGKSKSKAVKYRIEKRELVRQRQQEELERQEQEKQILKVTEFISVSELAALMNVQPTQIIQTCMSIGLFVSINQRLDAETITLVAEEFGYKVEFITADLDEVLKDDEGDKPEDLLPRPPIVTVMGHVDHGKTKLLDYIRNTNVVAGEAGGITQHIGAYRVTLDNGREITFLDTPGHEAFTAMRARGAKVTDIVIIVVAADDGVMPQTVEAINHAQAAGVPMIFAINKIDKPTANPDRVKEQLAAMNILVEEWGGKYQSQEISAKDGKNVNLLLDKVLLEADMLNLRANPNKKASGTVIESSLDKGRGYVANVLVQNGTLRVGDCVLAGSTYGTVKAIFNERGKKLEAAGPAMPALILGLNGAPQAGEYFKVMDEDKAKEIANKREQLQREQSQRTRKHITLDEIGRRIAIGNFKELNLIVKGDVDGSVEALSDALLKLSTPEIQVNIIHKAVGQISESDVLLAAASNAIIIGFQVRPSLNARKLAEREQIDIRLYSIIYSAIEEIKDAMEGMLSPEIKEEIKGTAEVKEIFKISKVGTVAGCVVKEGKIPRSSKVRIIRDGIVVYTGELGSLKRFKDDVKEVSAGQECGLNIQNFNDIKVGDVIEAFQEVEVKKTL